MKNYYKERFELQRRVARVLAPALEVNEILEDLREEARAVVATAMEACVLLLDTDAYRYTRPTAIGAVGDVRSSWGRERAI